MISGSSLCSQHLTDMCSSCDPSSCLALLPNNLFAKRTLPRCSPFPSLQSTFLSTTTPPLSFLVVTSSFNAMDCYLSPELCSLCFFWCSPTSHCRKPLCNSLLHCTAAAPFLSLQSNFPSTCIPPLLVCFSLWSLPLCTVLPIYLCFFWERPLAPTDHCLQ